MHRNKGGWGGWGLGSRGAVAEGMANRLVALEAEAYLLFLLLLGHFFTVAVFMVAIAEVAMGTVGGRAVELVFVVGAGIAIDRVEFWMMPFRKIFRCS